MNAIIKISLRNLFRQKKRNFLLGIAIAFGMMALVTANSFSNGISDVLLNKIVVYLFGHINISVSERGNSQNMMIRDKDRFIEIINQNVEGIKSIEEGVGGYGRILGKSKNDYIALAGVAPSKEFYDWCKVLSGDIKNYENRTIENPIILSESKAKYLDVQVNDIVRLKTSNVWGQTQTARLTVIAIVRLDNIFMEGALYLNLDDMKKIMGYRPNETGILQVNLNNPLKSIEQADKLHQALLPEKAVIQGTIKKNNVSTDIIALGVFRDDSAQAIINNNFEIIDGNIADSLKDNCVIVNKKTAAKLKLKINDKIILNYTHKFNDKSTTAELTVKAIINTNDSLDNLIFINEKTFFYYYYDNLPVMPEKQVIDNIKNSIKNIDNVVAAEWERLIRTATTDELKKKMNDLKEVKTRIAKLDVRTMYESASAVLKLESALNLITVAAMIILFFIILIGVINTLRMTIKERAREIGTMRAIGMQRKDVRNTFLLETFFLTLFSCVIGIIGSYIIMYLLTLIKFNDTSNMLSILLVNKSLHFVPQFSAILTSLLLILFIALATAFFPARRAANLKPSEALRHI